MSLFDGMFDLNNDEIDKMVDSHPLNVFSKLSNEDPGNALYQKCLDDEIKLAAKGFMEACGHELPFMEMVVEMIEQRANEDASVIDEESRIRMKTIKKIFAEIHRMQDEKHQSK